MPFYRTPPGLAGPGPNEVQVSVVCADAAASLQAEPESTFSANLESFPQQQLQDEKLKEIIEFKESKKLPLDEDRARKIALQDSLFVIVGVLYFIDPKCKGQRRVAVPKHMQQQIMEECHRGRVGGHFSGSKLFNALARHWWWERMFADVIHFTRNCPVCNCYRRWEA